MHIPILQEFITILAASILILYASHKLRIPYVVGLLLTGILIGPSGLRLVTDMSSIQALAEIGVVMLLFMIGLEFSLERLKQIQKNFWVGGPMQVLLTVLSVVVIFHISQISTVQSIFYGFLISLSSTAVVLRILSERGELDSPQGNVSLGILLFQDVSIVPMIALTPLLARASSLALQNLVLRFFGGALLVAAVILSGRFLMPKVLYFILKTRIREAFLITSLFFCLGMAFLTSCLGLSLALGAFLAGLIISESEYSHQVASDILPFKDVFNSIFFISIGLLLDLSLAFGNLLAILVLTLSIILLKALIVVLVASFMKYPLRTTLVCGLSLAQIGEFSFVLANLGRTHLLLPEETFQAFIAASVLTIMATPFLIQASPLLAEKAEDLFRRKSYITRKRGKAETSLKNHVIVAGYGLNGQNLVRGLKESGIPYIILELNPDTVKKARLLGEPILFGDISSREILKAASVESAKVIVFAISEPRATRTGVRISRQMNKTASIIVRTRYVSEIDELYQLGATQVIPEEFETSIEIFARTLEEFHVPRNIVDAQVQVIRDERYGMLRGLSQTPRSMQKISEILTAGTAETFFVSRDSPAAGKTLRDLNLRKETGATLIAIVRGEQSFASPRADFVIKEGDTLVLVASHENMDKAFCFLRGK